jgi:hypothetical protein
MPRISPCDLLEVPKEKRLRCPGKKAQELRVQPKIEPVCFVSLICVGLCLEELGWFFVGGKWYVVRAHESSS